MKQVGIILLLVVACALVDLFFTVGWILRLLEITSVFDRLLPTWTAIHFFIAAVIASVGAWLLMEASYKIIGIPEKH